MEWTGIPQTLEVLPGGSSISSGVPLFQSNLIVLWAGAPFAHTLVFALMLTFTFAYWPRNVSRIIPLAYCCYWKHNFKLSDLLSRAALKKKSEHSRAKKMIQRYLDKNRQVCSRSPNILAVLKSHLKSDEISFRKLFSMKNTLLNSTYKMLMQICWLLALLACRPSCNTGIINLTGSVEWAFSLQSPSRYAF